ncbi:GNAT family N-acetyltransferase [Roseibium porphyridii]|uniref:GNAT family N-acetyltransferase n=1 Tax=Roseibium porphyridii TaxID=2866279 RepID=A0ABY8FBQ2_9HYPH|nr:MULTISPECIES: GNAT family N-acetyltransferase [Stappiaceae]QFT29064.1 Acetyltransferase (GNAT) family protein [Labrenzia sp. THAF82]WFE90063.1 GNAT family N-acetyltransferase [Roseibium sp. KMA01]
MTIELVSQVPDVDIYLQLRTNGGLSGYDRNAAEIGLKNSLFSVLLLDEGTPIGMGRLIGDGGCFVQVTDIVVLPAYQGLGLGKRIMAALTEFIETRLPPTTYVSLIADVPANKLYEQFGFRETAPASIGMSRRSS